MMDIRFSVIIPVYNSEQYISECLDSVVNQLYPVHEILICNDGSVDKTEEIIFKYMALHPNIRYIKHENQGQGITRNKLLGMVTGDYVVILDSDDMLENHTLELCVQRIQNESPSFIYFEYKTLNEAKRPRIEYNFVNPLYGSLNMLNGGDCSILLSNKAYYTCTGVYNRNFLWDNGIRYGEGHIYEDHEFYIRSCLCAKRISLVHSPLYTYRIHEQSTTGASDNYKSALHYTGELLSLKKAISLIYACNASGKAIAYIMNHSFLAFLFCYRLKTPARYKWVFLKQFVDLVSPLIFEEERLLNRGFYALYKNRKLLNKKYALVFCHIHYLMLVSFLKRSKSNIKAYLAKLKRQAKAFTSPHAQEPLKLGQKVSMLAGICKAFILKNRGLGNKRPLLNDTFLFLGFDTRYTGNSRYLYEQMKAMFPQYKYFYVTRDSRVPDNERIEKGSSDYFYYIAYAKVIILESYDLWNCVKSEGQIWIQTWHATTIKKILFDTPEPYTNKKNANQKVLKYKSILNWDYLITDCHYIKKIYRSCFLINEAQIKDLGYPRVKFLIDNKDNAALKTGIRNDLCIPLDKKAILYAPTWRDYNYNNSNFEYLLDLDMLSSLLGEEYVILFKDHDFIKKTDNKHGVFINVNNNETQELILISDFIVTDYSSIIFDGIAIDIPFFIYANDKEQYSYARGVYEEIFDDIAMWEVLHEMDLCKKIKGYSNDGSYAYIKEKYTHQDSVYAMPEFLAELMTSN